MALAEAKFPLGHPMFLSVFPGYVLPQTASGRQLDGTIWTRPCDLQMMNLHTKRSHYLIVPHSMWIKYLQVSLKDIYLNFLDILPRCGWHTRPCSCKSSDK